MTLTTSAFTSGAEIPNQYTCKGEDVSPALEWSGAPPHAASFAVVMDDPDAPAGTWVHWVLWNVPANAHSLSQGVPKRDQLQEGARQGRNSFRKIGYNGPCPPPGKPHRYLFKLYALGTELTLPAGVSKRDVEHAMEGHIVGHAEWMGKYKR